VLSSRLRYVCFTMLREFAQHGELRVAKRVAIPEMTEFACG